MSKRFRGFKASLQPDGVLEILVYGDIGASWWGDGGITTGTVRQQIDQAGASNFQRIAVRVDSDGGDAFDGIGIYNVLRAQKKPIDVFVDGLAASAASIIAMAGDTITMGLNTVMLIHNASAGFYGDANYLRKQADALDTVSRAIAQTYVERTGLALKDVQKLLDAETWMTAQECLDQKFCTAIAGSSQEAEESEITSGRARAQARLKPVKNAACGCACKNCVANNCKDCTVSDCDDLNCNDCPMQAKANPVQNAACGCGCKNCAAKNCKDCTVSDCDDLNCNDCPMQAKAKTTVANADDLPCPCPCENCQAGDCEECTNTACEYPACDDCPMQTVPAASVDRARIQLQMMKTKSASGQA